MKVSHNGDKLDESHVVTNSDRVKTLETERDELKARIKELTHTIERNDSEYRERIGTFKARIKELEADLNYLKEWSPVDLDWILEEHKKEAKQ